MQSKQPKLIVFSGAGLSAESGIQTFRDDGSGLWHNHKLEEVCNIHSALRNRHKVFDFYNMRLAEEQKAQPNAAHVALAQMQAQFGIERVLLVTQNVDTLLERAGATAVTHLHGDLGGYLCLQCRRSFDRPGGVFDLSQRCALCGSDKLKPRVVFFGEQAPRYQDLAEIQSNTRPDDIVLAIGTSWNVIGPERVVHWQAKGKPTVIQIDPNPRQRTWFGQNLQGGAAQLLPQLQSKIEQYLAGNSVNWASV